MLILGACVVSSVVSVIVVRYNEFRMYKDTADKGYKINIKKVLNNTNQNKRKHNYKNLLLLFPIVNLFIAADNVIKYNKIKPFLVDRLKSTDFIEEMTEEEKKIYQSNPTINNAINIIVYSRFKEEKAKQQSTETEIKKEYEKVNISNNTNHIKVKKLVLTKK